MGYRLPKSPFKTDPKTGKIIGAVKVPDEEIAAQNKVEGDPEAAKQAMEAFGLGSYTGLIDNAVAGKNPFSTNVSVPAENELVGKQQGATTGDAAELQNQNDAPKETTTQEEAELEDENILHNFATVQHLWSLGALTAGELNDPDGTYRKDGRAFPKHTVIDSTGRTVGQRVRTYAEKQYNKTVPFYIDNVEINSTIAPNPKSRQTNFWNISFEVREPYSMGQFIQSLNVCSKSAGYENYLTAPFLLACKFVGYNTQGKEVKDVGLTRLFAVKLVSMDFNVDQAGSVYNIQCSAFNDEAFEDINQSLPVSMTISGETLHGALTNGLNSLTTHYNTHLLKKKQDTDEKAEVDEVMVVFPKKTSSQSLKEALGSIEKSETATTGDLALKPFIDEAIDLAFDRGGGEDAVGFEGRPPVAGSLKEQKRRFVEGRLGYSIKRGNLSEALKQVYLNNLSSSNYIGLQKVFTEDALAPGNIPFGLANFSYNPENGLLEKGNISINNKLRTVTFEAGTKIQKVIEEMVLLSQWGDKIFNGGKADKNGNIEWFRIESSVYLIDDKKSEKVYGRKPRIYVYKVVPYTVHESQFQMPGSAPRGFDYLLKNKARTYNYIYTGQNRDILSFDLNFDNAFYESLALDQGNNKGNTDTSSGGSKKAVQDTRGPDASIQGASSVEGDADGSQIKRTNTKLDGEGVGAMTETVARQVARQFNEAIVNSSASLISIQMEITGDPYYLADSGVGNYNSEATDLINLNIDAGINYQSGEVDILINFKSPLDANPDNNNYDMTGSAIDLDDFSGLYKVNEVSSKFEKNVFTQTLQCVRRKNFQLSDKGADTDEKALAPKDEYTKRKEEALENGDLDVIEFAYADKNADGKLSVGERVNAGLTREEAIDLATKANKALNTPTSQGSSANSNPNEDRAREEAAAAPTTNQTAPSRSGSNIRTNKDMFYNYGKQNR